MPQKNSAVDISFSLPGTLVTGEENLSRNRNKIGEIFQYMFLMVPCESRERDRQLVRCGKNSTEVLNVASESSAYLNFADLPYVTGGGVSGSKNKVEFWL